jgi:hypothetical protein
MIDFQISLNKADCDRLKKKVLSLASGIESKIQEPLKKAGEQYCEIVISHMGFHSGGRVMGEYWKQLSKFWLKQKQEHGWVMEIWEATGRTKGAVRVHNIEQVPGGFKLFAGISGVSSAELQKAIQNEFGAVLEDRNIPSRPLFIPAIREMVHNLFERGKYIGAFKVIVKDALNAIR